MGADIYPQDKGPAQAIAHVKTQQKVCTSLTRCRAQSASRIWACRSALGQRGPCSCLHPSKHAGMVGIGELGKVSPLQRSSQPPSGEPCPETSLISLLQPHGGDRLSNIVRLQPTAPRAAGYGEGICSGCVHPGLGATGLSMGLEAEPPDALFSPTMGLRPNEASLMGHDLQTCCQGW